jgi:hypothetical protein
MKYEHTDMAGDTCIDLFFVATGDTAGDIVRFLAAGEDSCNMSNLVAVIVYLELNRRVILDINTCSLVHGNWNSRRNPKSSLLRSDS